MDKKIIILFTVVLIIAAAFLVYYYLSDSLGGQTPPPNQQTNNQQENQNPMPQNNQPASEPAPASAVVAIETTKGSFEVTLDGKAAPLTVANFLKLVNDGFYAGLTFHRIVDGFMIQGGDPSGDGTGGPGYTVPAEIQLKHTKGAIAMARLGDPVNPEKASSGSQFYITLADQPFLDGGYTVFGYVTSGMETVEAIGRTPTEFDPLGREKSVPLEKVEIVSMQVKSVTQ